MDQLWSFASEYCPLLNSQFGFRAHRSCASQLIGYVDSLSLGLDSGLCSDVAYLDISKAFDKVSHGKLIKKLLDRNIPLTLVKWIQNFLSNRCQYVKINQFARN